MGLFRSKEEAELDILIDKIESNMANNYKDAAQQGFRELEEAFARAKEAGRMKEKKLKRYESAVDFYRIRLQNFTHKDQKPYWT